MSNVTQYRNCFGRHYYVDIFGQLWYSEEDVTEIWYYGESYEADDEPTDDFVYTNLGTRLKSLGHRVNQRPIKIMDNVNMVHPTSIGDFILLENGKLYFVGFKSNDLILKRIDVKVVSGTSSLCFFINNQSELFYYQMDDHDHLTSQFIRARVKYAFGNIAGTETLTNEIYLEDLDKKQWIWTHSSIRPRDRDPETYYLHLKDSTLIYSLKLTGLNDCITYVIDTNVLHYEEYGRVLYYIKRF